MLKVIKTIFQIYGINMESVWNRYRGLNLRNWYEICWKSLQSRYEIGTKLVRNWYKIGTNLVSNWYKFGTKLVRIGRFEFSLEIWFRKVSWEMRASNLTSKSLSFKNKLTSSCQRSVLDEIVKQIRFAQSFDLRNCENK